MASRQVKIGKAAPPEESELWGEHTMASPPAKIAKRSLYEESDRCAPNFTSYLVVAHTSSGTWDAVGHAPSVSG